MNTKKDCCEECSKANYFCEYRGCKCHTDSTKKYGQPEHKGNGDTIGSLKELAKVMQAPQHTSFSDFFHNASPEEKEQVMLEVAREATNDQRAQIGLPPLHTSPEKEIDPNQMMHDLHEEIERVQNVPSLNTSYAQGYIQGKFDRTVEILALIEKKKAFVHEVDSELFGWELIGEEGEAACCPGDDAAFGYEAALTSLAEELGK